MWLAAPSAKTVNVARKLVNDAGSNKKDHFKLVPPAKISSNSC